MSTTPPDFPRPEDEAAYPAPNAPSNPGPSEPRLLTRRDPEAGQPSGSEREPTRRFDPADTEIPAAPANPRPTAADRLHSARRRYEALRDRLATQTHPTDPGALELTATPKPRRRTRLPRVLAGLLAAFLLFAVLTGLVLTLSFRHDLQASLPQLDGSLRVPGLSAPVTVTRNPQGVPSITAATTDDLVFAQGYITVQDRLWQMDVLRRHAAGELAEILGPTLVTHDKTQRILGLRSAAERALATLPPDQLHALDTYSRGVNAFLQTHPDTLPVEFHLLHYRPALWRPLDSLLVWLAMAQDLTTVFPEKLKREQLSTHLPANLLSDLYPVGFWRDRPPADAVPDLVTPHDVLQIPLDDSQSRLHTPAEPTATPADLHQLAALLGTERCRDCHPGSNNWAVSGRRSASGKPLLSNDMHLSLSVPDIWYEAALHTTPAAGASAPAALDVIGFTLPGVPFVIAGRNAHLAWSITNLTGDVQDVRLEHLRNPGPNAEYQRPDGSWTPVGHRPELIRVRFSRDIRLDVQTTTAPLGNGTIETPIITPLLPSEHRALSLAWTLYDPSTLRQPLESIDRASDGASLVATLADCPTIPLNIVYADDSGHIGYHAIGHIPVRGPATPHPRAAAPTLPTGIAPPDEDDNGTQTESPNPDDTGVLQQPAAHFIKAAYTLPSPAFAYPGDRRGFAFSVAYHPQRRRGSRRQPTPAPAPAKHRRTRRSTTPPAAPQPAPEPAAANEPTPDSPITPLPTDYTIGSPIPAVPVDALDASQAWSGYVPFDQLPSITDPASGVLATANARVTPDLYPYQLASDWVAPYRVERIYHQLETRSALTPVDMLALQNDMHSELDLAVAQRLAYALDHASPAALGHNAARLHQAADILRRWDGNMTAVSPAAAIVSAARGALWPMLLMPQIKAHDDQATERSQTKHRRSPAELARLYSWNEEDCALESLLQHQPARWLPAGFANWNDFLAAALANGLSDTHAPSDLSTWSYGPLHPMILNHPLLSNSPLFSRLLGVQADPGARPNGGDGTTVRATGLHFGPSERFTADLSSPSATTGNITTGQSGNPASPHYLDQFEPWLRGSTFPLPLTNDTITHTLTLTP